MKKLNYNEMLAVNAGGCGWLRREARRARRGGQWGLEQMYVDAWIVCKKL